MKIFAFFTFCVHWSMKSMLVYFGNFRGTYGLLCSQATDFPGQEQVQYAQVQADCPLHEQGRNLPGIWDYACTHTHTHTLESNRGFVNPMTFFPDSQSTVRVVLGWNINHLDFQLSGQLIFVCSTSLRDWEKNCMFADSLRQNRGRRGCVRCILPWVAPLWCEGRVDQLRGCVLHWTTFGQTGKTTFVFSESVGFAEKVSWMLGISVFFGQLTYFLKTAFVWAGVWFDWSQFSCN